MSGKRNDKEWAIMQEAARRLNRQSRHTSSSGNSHVREQIDRAFARPRIPVGEVRRSAVVPVPNRLFKYLRREHAERLINEGSTRVGTLHDFRNEERHGVGVGDAGEGRKLLSMHPEPQFVNAGSPMAKQLEAMGAIKMGPGVTIQLGGESVIASEHDHHDVFVWCCSTDLSTDAMANLGAANTCVEIFDVPNFFTALDAAVRAKYEVQTLGPARVVYGSRHEEWNGEDMGTHPVFLKGPSFANQAEVRVAWSPLTSVDKLEWFIIERSDVGRFCRIIEMPDPAG
ncbi:MULTISPECIES: hypothetical protein [Burkholderia cepacia complex]|uniref:hypothetical protein n=1 Tax=Burkholderia cepacia complex TaxID=87882 RepID=UPI0012AECCBB|nr:MULTISPECIES: hypothetical protein [Burkholderia cepacia complex]MDN7779384.1 hypothetical protein [Burkholderia orbicola]